MSQKIADLKDKTFLILWLSLTELITSPSKAWESLKKISSNKKTPIFKVTIISILISSALNFLGTSLVFDEFNFTSGLKSGCTTFFTLFISVYISSFINLIIFENLTKKDAKISEIFNYTALLYSLTFLIYGLEPILSLIFFYKLFIIYTIYIAWNGAERFIEVPAENKVFFSTGCGICVILTPIAITYLLHYLMPGLT